MGHGRLVGFESIIPTPTLVSAALESFADTTFPIVHAGDRLPLNLLRDIDFRSFGMVERMQDGANFLMGEHRLNAARAVGKRLDSRTRAGAQLEEYTAIVVGWPTFEAGGCRPDADEAISGIEIGKRAGSGWVWTWRVCFVHGFLHEAWVGRITRLASGNARKRGVDQSIAKRWAISTSSSQQWNDASFSLRPAATQ